MPDDRSLDPRFDPRYQRGFDPSTMPVEPERLRAPVEHAGPVPPASPVPAAGAHEPDRRDAVGSGLRIDEDEIEDEEEFEPVSTRNPFRLALLLVSVGLLVLAGATLWWTANNQSAFLFGSSVESAWGWMFQQLTAIVPAAAILAGLVGLTIWLGLGALNAKAAAQAAEKETAKASANDRESPRGE